MCTRYTLYICITGIQMFRLCRMMISGAKFSKKDLEVKKKCVSLQPVSEKGVFETFRDETASSLKNEKIEKNFGGFEKVATFAAPFEKTREAKKKIIEKTERLSTRKYN